MPHRPNKMNKHNHSPHVRRFLTSVVAIVFGGFLLSLIVRYPYEIFSLCCQIMATGAHLLGLTYKEFCVLGNIYLQSLVLVLSAFAISYVAWKKVKEKKSGVRVLTFTVSILYSVVHLAVFFIICKHYAMPLEDAFDLCVDELKYFGKVFYHVGYVGANLVIFVIGWLLVFLFNIAAYRLVCRIGNNK